MIAPIFEKLSTVLSRPNVVTFVKVDTEHQQEITSTYGVRALPTFIVFRDGNEVDRVQGADPPKLQAILKKLNTEIESAGNAGESSISGAGASASTGTGPVWRGAELPRGYKDITDQVEIPRCELLNVDSDVGGVRVLFAPDKPGALSGGKKTEKDWVESDTDEQLMLFIPFQSMIKLHTLQVCLAWPRLYSHHL